MQPFLAAFAFLLELYVCFDDCRGCVGTAITIDFGKQVRIVCLPGRGMDRNCKHGGSPFPVAVPFGHLQQQIVLTEPL